MERYTVFHQTKFAFGEDTKPSTTGLRGGHFRGHSFSQQNFRDQDLRMTDFYGADLRFIDGQGADFRGCNLSRANLHGACLCGANFRNADLSLVDLSGADLKGADLRGARLWGANLAGADLSGADLRLADIRQVFLEGAQIVGALFSSYQIVPSEGAFVGWRWWGGYLFKVEVPATAQRCNSIGSRQARADRVCLLAVWDEQGEPVLEGSTIVVDGLSLLVAVASELVATAYNDDVRCARGAGFPFFLSADEAMDREG